MSTQDGRRVLTYQAPAVERHAGDTVRLLLGSLTFAVVTLMTVRGPPDPPGAVHLPPPAPPQLGMTVRGEGTVELWVESQGRATSVIVIPEGCRGP